MTLAYTEVTVTLELMTPLHIGTGLVENFKVKVKDKEINSQYATIVRCSEGNPVLPASSIKGALRDALAGDDLLFEMFGERIPLKSPDANLSSVGTRLQGADTPDPYSKGRQWVEFMSARYRSRGMTLLLGQPFEIKLGENTSTDRFPCLLPVRFTLPELVGCCH